MIDFAEILAKYVGVFKSHTEKRWTYDPYSLDDSEIQIAMAVMEYLNQRDAENDAKKNLQNTGN